LTGYVAIAPYSKSLKVNIYMEGRVAGTKDPEVSVTEHVKEFAGYCIYSACTWIASGIAFDILAMLFVQDEIEADTIYDIDCDHLEFASLLCASILSDM
jgi:hypothetical protein